MGAAPAWLAILTAFATSFAGTAWFCRFAVQKGIVANPNFRSLHERPMPRAGGIVFAATFVVTAAALWVATHGDRTLSLALLGGGGAAALFGLADDIVQLSAPTQLAAQALLAGWALWCVDRPLVDLAWTPRWLEFLVTWAAFVWFLNLYNFMDGIDGMAASGALFLSATAIVLLLIADGDPAIVGVVGVLAASVLGFLCFNWPPARIFMGSAGSYFLGYGFCALIAYTVTRGQLSPWAWLVMLGYFAGDTTTTTILRMFVAERWYGEHRSHAYQNLARVWRSHRRVVIGVTLYHVLWLLPLAVIVTIYPAAAPAAVVLAFAPVVIWTWRFGPRLSSS